MAVILILNIVKWPSSLLLFESARCNDGMPIRCEIQSMANRMTPHNFLARGVRCHRTRQALWMNRFQNGTFYRSSSIHQSLHRNSTAPITTRTITITTTTTTARFSSSSATTKDPYDEYRRRRNPPSISRHLWNELQLENLNTQQQMDPDLCQTLFQELQAILLTLFKYGET